MESIAADLAHVPPPRLDLLELLTFHGVLSLHLPELDLFYKLTWYLDFSVYHLLDCTLSDKY
jgi:hypothetical protein